MLEIRAGTGGDEAGLFAGELFRMYTRFADRQGWKVDVLSTSESGVGAIKEVIALVEGRQVYHQMKHESGVHRVQRVPATEASGRIHTSTATVAVLPEAEEVDIAIDPKDLFNPGKIFPTGATCVDVSQAAAVAKAGPGAYV